MKIKIKNKFNFALIIFVTFFLAFAKTKVMLNMYLTQPFSFKRYNTIVYH